MARFVQEAPALTADQQALLLELIPTLHADLDLPVLYAAIADGMDRVGMGEQTALYVQLDGVTRCVIAHSARHVEDTAAFSPLSPQWPPLRQLQATKQPVFVADTATHAQWSEIASTRPAAGSIKSWLAIPICANGRMFGFIDVGYAEPHSHVPAELTVLQAYADQVAAVLRSALLLAETEAQTARLRVRSAMSTRMRTARMVDDVLKAAVEEIHEALHASLCVAALQRGGAPVRPWARHPGGESPSSRRLDSVLQPLLALAIAQQRTLVINDTGGDSSPDHVAAAYRESLAAHGVQALLVTPVLDHGDAVGVLALAQVGVSRPWSSGDRILVEEAASDIGGALADARMRHGVEQQAVRAGMERDRLRAVIDQLPVGIVVAETPPDGPMLWNKVAGSLVASLEGDTPYFEALYTDGTPYPVEQHPLVRSYEQGIVIHAEEVLLRRRDDTLIPALVDVAPIREQGGTAVGGMAVLTDLAAHKRAEQHAQQQDLRILALSAIAAGLAVTGPINEVMVSVAQHVQSLVPYDALTITMLDSTRNGLERVASIGSVIEAFTEEEQIALQDAPVASVIETGEPSLLADLSGLPLKSAQSAAQAGLHGCLIVAIKVDGRVEGTLNLMSRRPNAYTQDDVALAAHIAALVSMAIERNRIAHLARESAVGEERERLAREIHDTLAQTITGVVMQLDSVVMSLGGDSPVRARLEQAQSMARSALAEARRSVWNLRSATMDLQAPRAIMKQESQVLERRAGIRPSVATTGEPREVAPEVGAVLQRLTRVALDNVRAHSGASQVRILLDFGLQNLTVLIEDDGQGFDPDTVDVKGPGRVGLAGVAERARLIGGQLRIESASGHGTRVYAELPYTPVAPAPVTVPAPTPKPEVQSPTAQNVTRVLLIDDHTMVREGLERMLADQPDLRIVGAEATGTDGLRRISELKPDVVLCDLQLPDMSGVEVIARAHAHFPEVRCLVVTTYDSDDFIYEGIKAGAKGYVLKDVSSAELVNAVRAAARDESLLQPVVARKLVERFADLARQGGVVEALTEREVEVLKALASGARNKEIAFDLGLSESTIKTHLASIFGKLGVTTRTEAVSRGRELGLVSL